MSRKRKAVDVNSTQEKFKEYEEKLRYIECYGHTRECFESIYHLFITDEQPTVEHNVSVVKFIQYSHNYDSWTSSCGYCGGHVDVFGHIQLERAETGTREFCSAHYKDFHHILQQFNTEKELPIDKKRSRVLTEQLTDLTHIPFVLIVLIAQFIY